MAMSLENKGYKSEINITPYIDILLVLLIIFMVATPMKKYNEQVRVPKPAAVQPQTVDPLVIEVDLNHDIRINQQPVTLADLERTLYAVFGGRTDKNMYIRGDSGLNYGYVFQILDIAKRSGAGDIALLEKGSSTSTPASRPSTGVPTTEAASAR
jgi:biopolymer transport protein ExbD